MSIIGNVYNKLFFDKITSIIKAKISIEPNNCLLLQFLL